MNCLLYARVSTDKQAQKDLWIPAQIEYEKEHAKRNRLISSLNPES
jgi:DNA invertase Pin-like site-specific DNA recombinase